MRLQKLGGVYYFNKGIFTIMGSGIACYSGKLTYDLLGNIGQYNPNGPISDNVVAGALCLTTAGGLMLVVSGIKSFVDLRKGNKRLQPNKLEDIISGI